MSKDILKAIILGHGTLCRKNRFGFIFFFFFFCLQNKSDPWERLSAKTAPSLSWCIFLLNFAYMKDDPHQTFTQCSVGRVTQTAQVRNTWYSLNRTAFLWPSNQPRSISKNTQNTELPRNSSNKTMGGFQTVFIFHTLKSWCRVITAFVSKTGSLHKWLTIDTYVLHFHC